MVLTIGFGWAIYGTPNPYKKPGLKFLCLHFSICVCHPRTGAMLIWDIARRSLPSRCVTTSSPEEAEEEDEDEEGEGEGDEEDDEKEEDGQKDEDDKHDVGREDRDDKMNIEKKMMQSRDVIKRHPSPSFFNI